MFRHVISQALELRLLEERHAEEVFLLCDRDRDRLRQWLPWVDGTLSPDDTREFIRRSLEQFARGESLVAGIWQDGSLAGVVSFVNINPANRSALIGYWLGPEYEGRGIMTRACRELIDYGFEELGLNRIVIRASTENLRSQAVPQRLGFTREGVERQSEWLNDRFIDMVVFSMLRSEWRGRA
jgi:ribosomal-protein-serine acetyltransferase